MMLSDLVFTMSIMMLCVCARACVYARACVLSTVIAGITSTEYNSLFSSQVIYVCDQKYLRNAHHVVPVNLLV